MIFFINKKLFFGQYIKVIRNLFWEVLVMKAGDQRIECTVKSCKYNKEAQSLCDLSAIKVDPCNNGSTGSPKDETLCASYDCKS